MKNGRCYVYSRINPDNGMVYFGCSSDPFTRWGAQNSCINRGVEAPAKMIEDVQGGVILVNKVLVSYDNLVSARKMEAHLIQTFSENAYNTNGNPVRGHRKCTWSE